MNRVLWSEVGIITKHRGKGYIMKLMGHLLVTIGEDKMMYIWDIQRILNRKYDISKILNKDNCMVLKKPVQSIDFNAMDNKNINDEDIIECIGHSPTYLDKIIIGYKSGKMQLWNINTCQCIYTFMNHYNFDISSNDNNVGITCIEPAPLLDIVGIGYDNGCIVVHNIKTDKQVMQFEHYNHKSMHGKKQDNFSMDSIHGRINGLTFRGDGIPYLVSVGSDKNIVIWNLKKRKSENIYYYVHLDRIISAKFQSQSPCSFKLFSLQQF